MCKFRAEKIDYINYKDVRLLPPFLPERRKMQLPRSPACARCTSTSCQMLHGSSRWA
jgi:ribosomal protein S18